MFSNGGDRKKKGGNGEVERKESTMQQKLLRPGAGDFSPSLLLKEGDLRAEGQKVHKLKVSL